MFDLDGVVIDSTHRYRTKKDIYGQTKIDLEHWRDNEHLCYNDTLLPHAIVYKRALANPNTLCIVATAREMKQPDFDFIAKHLGKPNAIVYRAQGDTEKGAILKIQGINNIFKSLGRHFTGRKMRIYEDNAEYLTAMCNHFKCFGEFVPSKQGY